MMDLIRDKILQKKGKRIKPRGGPQSSFDCVVALHPEATGSILGIPKNFLLMLLRFTDNTA